MTEVICIGGFVIAAAAIVGIDLARIARAIERLQERLDDGGRERPQRGDGGAGDFSPPVK